MSFFSLGVRRTNPFLGLFLQSICSLRSNGMLLRILQACPVEARERRLPSTRSRTDASGTMMALLTSPTWVKLAARCDRVSLTRRAPHLNPARLRRVGTSSTCTEHVKKNIKKMRRAQPTRHSPRPRGSDVAILPRHLSPRRRSAAVAPERWRVARRRRAGTNHTNATRSKTRWGGVRRAKWSGWYRTSRWRWEGTSRRAAPPGRRTTEVDFPSGSSRCSSRWASSSRTRRAAETTTRRCVCEKKKNQKQKQHRGEGRTMHNPARRLLHLDRRSRRRRRSSLATTRVISLVRRLGTRASRRQHARSSNPRTVPLAGASAKSREGRGKLRQKPYHRGGSRGRRRSPEEAQAAHA